MAGAYAFAPTRLLQGRFRSRDVNHSIQPQSGAILKHVRLNCRVRNEEGDDNEDR
jgi:hypothetical protein